MRRKIFLTCGLLFALLGSILFLRVVSRGVGIFQSIPLSARYDFSPATPKPLNPDPVMSNKLTQTAWIPDWDFAKGMQSLKQSYRNFDNISPVWYYLEKDGKVREAKKGLDEMLKFTAENNLKLIPSIASFDPTHVGVVFEDPEKVKRHVEYLLDEVEKYDFAGLDIDYEAIYYHHQPGYLSMLRQLYEALDKQGKILSVTVLSKWTDQALGIGLMETRSTQDWFAISEVAHEVRIMAYEVTATVSESPGPISPVPWVEAILRYATTRIPREKVVLAIHLYAYDGWSQNLDYVSPYQGFINPYLDKFQADAITYADVLKKLPKAKRQFMDEISKEKILIYTDKDIFDKTGDSDADYILMYQDAETMQYRIDLAKEFGIAGVAHWRMGGEDLRVYPLAKK